MKTKCILISIFIMVMVLTGCVTQTSPVDANEYSENLEITGKYDKALSAKCENGTFVGYMQDNILTFKGIPFATQPVGDKRFLPPTDPEPSDKVFEAYHYGSTSMQSIDPGELSSLYHQGEDCLNLNVWSNTSSKNEKKPVLVFIHGGGWLQGGASDPQYNGYNFVKNNPDILFVSVDYRVGMLGLIDLSSFPDGDKYKTSTSNAILDMVQSLKWINRNIEAFGGDSNNVTIIGESAGGGAVSTLCIIPEAKGLFQKAIPMSGGSNQGQSLEKCAKLTEALKNDLGITSVEDLNKIPFDKLREYWGENSINIYNLLIRDGITIPEDPFTSWEKGVTKDLIILQGHTTNEFRYYQLVFGGIEEMYDAVCQCSFEVIQNSNNSEAKSDLKEYCKALTDLGYSGKDIAREYMNDKTLAACNLYQASCHAENGGKGYFYLFDKAYDNPDYLGAAHAIDCFYLFGTFDGYEVLGTEEEIELSKNFQKMIANFCKTGDPSLDSLVWPEYDTKNRKTMIINDNIHVEDNPQENRVKAEIKLMKSSPLFRYSSALSQIMPMVYEKYPDAYKKYMNWTIENQKSQN